MIATGPASHNPEEGPLQTWSDALREERGSALLEFALTLPLLVVFVVGIYDFGGAFNQKQKIEQAAQEGAIIAAAQPMSDIVTNSSSTATNPDSLQVVVTTIVKSLTRQWSAAEWEPAPLPGSIYTIRAGRPDVDLHDQWVFQPWRPIIHHDQPWMGMHIRASLYIRSTSSRRNSDYGRKSVSLAVQ